MNAKWMRGFFGLTRAVFLSKNDTDISISLQYRPRISVKDINNPTAAAPMGAAITFRNVGQVFGSVRALRDFSLDVEAGEFVTFLGPSGSGKTTALNLLAGFLSPSEGDILIDGQSIARLPTERRNIGMVFQSYSLFPHMSVLENVAFPLRMRGVALAERRGRANAALELVQLAGYGARRPHELSGGQRQRVAFARAVVFEPGVLLMDEPLGALDLKLRDAMQTEIRQIQRRIGCTVIYVTHDQGEALSMSNRIVVMDRGEIQQVGTPLEIYDRPASPFVANFVGEINLLAASVDGGALVLPGRRCALPTAHALAPGWKGFGAIRPERIERDLRGERVVAVRAQVVDVAFQGSLLRYTVQVQELGRLVVHEVRRFGTTPLAVGDTADFGFDLERMVFVNS
jgi:putative spermidine/putrescine transport system ATP-binding protein